MEKKSQKYYYHLDGLGSVTGITDSTGNVVQRYKYNSFGNIVSMVDPNFIQPYLSSTVGADFKKAKQLLEEISDINREILRRRELL